MWPSEAETLRVGFQKKIPKANGLSIKTSHILSKSAHNKLKYLSRYLPYVREGELVEAPLVTQEDGRTAYAPMVEIGDKTRRRRFYNREALRGLQNTEE